MTRYAFINADGIVVQVIVGDLDERQQAQFLNDYRAIFGATQVIPVEADAAVWIGGSYTDGAFKPEPVPEILAEPLPEVVTETI